MIEQEITYKDFYKHPQLVQNSAKIEDMRKNYPIDCIYPVEDKATLVGIEVEVENLESFPQWNGVLWSTTEDGSLRNYGKEFVSNPIRGDTIEYAVRALFKSLADFEYKFSRRCSIHVHLNVRTMTPKQLESMMLVYLCFERALFKFVGSNRDKNIHCVPLLDTNLVKQLLPIIQLKASANNWMKYTAVNLVPISSKGTVEFRHMPGTDDIPKIMTWINFIIKMKMFAYRNKPEDILSRIMSLNSNSQYRSFAIDVFGELSDTLMNIDDYKTIQDGMEEGVIQVKSLIQGNNFIRNLVPNKKTIFSTRLIKAKIPKPETIIWDAVLMDMP